MALGRVWVMVKETLGRIAKRVVVGGVSLAATKNWVSGKKYFVDRSIVCFCCVVKGHFKSECPRMWPVLESLASSNVKMFRKNRHTPI